MQTVDAGFDPTNCSAPKRLAISYAGVDAGVGTGPSAWPVVSARRRPSSTIKSWPASCAEVITISS
ncbi:MAG: hypothetical protein ACTMKZ_15415 [Brevibacterium aurantiacum]|uniref:hypothetical protein n=1 Tax=Brevibacterium aurantiacum TaxID=273384 RepID=UPI003F9033AE